ncbi:MAG: tetratricopeptide repeat protein [Cyanobacteria bacterium P01_F01_bin.143]
MSDSPKPEQQLQTIFSNVSAGGNITTGNITQIFKNALNLDLLPKPKGIPQNIISSSTDKFVGREKDLENLNQQLQRHNQVVIAAVEGMGGVGKTELAIQYSLLNLQLKTYPGGICWLRSRDQDIGLQIVNFARTDLDLNPPEDLELPDRVRWCWKRWREGNTLIVLDDVKNYSDIKPYLPPQPSQFKVLITTRLKLDLPSSLYLAVLSEFNSLELLSQLVGSEKVEQELETAKELCQRLGYLPLALQLVGRYVKEYEISLTEELQLLADKGLGHPSLEVPENDPAWTIDIKRGVKAAFELSWDELKKFKFAQELGCLLSLFALAPIPWSLVESAAVAQEKEELRYARVQLKKLHLLQSENGYQLHQLIQEFFRNKQNNLVNTNQQKLNFCNELVKIAKAFEEKILQTITLSDINYLTPFIPHLAEIANLYQNQLSEQVFIKPFIALGRFYHCQGLYEQALPWYENCMSLAKKRFGEEHISVATSLNDLAELYRSQGRYKDAEPLCLKALTLYRKLLGEEHISVATSLNNIAELYRNQGRYEKAETLYIQALELRKKLLGEEHPGVAYVLNNQGLLYNRQEKSMEKLNLCASRL